MSGTIRRSTVVRTVALAGLAGLAVAGCSSSTPDKPVAGATTVKVGLTDAGCAPDAKSVAAGPVTFAISNTASGSVTEAELLQKSGDILGEKENVAPGLSGNFSLKLAPGSYKLYCPGGNTDGYTDFTVTGTSATSAPVAPAVTAALKQATDGYATYVRAEVGQLVANTRILTDRVRANDLAGAESAYAAPRVNYERIEPVAEGFGNLDPDLDSRIADVAPGSTWTGFHRLEKAIYKDKSLAGMTTIADGLDANVSKLNTLVATQAYQPAQLSNGATELLDEVGATKITGEEEAYSLIDLTDFAGNVAGSEKAFDLLKPALTVTDPALATQVSTRFTALDAALAKYSTGADATDYVTYDKVPVDQHKVLSGLVDAVAEPLAQVGGRIVSA